MIYNVKIFKAFGGRGGTRSQWSNRYRLNLGDDITADEVTNAVNALVNWEKGFHLNATHFMRAVISTAERGDSENNPNSLRTIDLSGTGAREDVAEPIFLECTMHARFLASSGRSGGNFYRGCLSEAMVTNAADGGPAMSGIPFMFIENSADLLTTLGAGVLVIAGAGPHPADYAGRPVVRIEPGSAAVRQRTARRKKKVIESESSALGMVADALGIAGALAAFWFSRGKSLPLPVRTTEGTAVKGAGTALLEVGQRFVDVVDGTP